MTAFATPPGPGPKPPGPTHPAPTHPPKLADALANFALVIESLVLRGQRPPPRPSTPRPGPQYPAANPATSTRRR